MYQQKPTIVFTLCVCTQRVFVCGHTCDHVLPVLHDEAAGSQTSDNVSETRAVSPPSVLYLLRLVFNTSDCSATAFEETQRVLAFLSTSWIPGTSTGGVRLKKTVQLKNNTV